MSAFTPRGKKGKEDPLGEARTPLVSSAEPEGGHGRSLSPTPPARDPTAVTAATEAAYRNSVRSLCAVHLILSTDFFIVQPTLYTYLQESFGEGRAFQGYTMGAFFAAQTIFGPVFGYVSDRAPVRVVLCAAMVVCATGNLMYALATSKWMLFAGRVIAGASAAVDSVTYGYIGQVSQRKNLTSAMATLRAFFALGQVLAPLASLLISVSKIDTHAGSLHVTVYTAPSLITAISCAAYALFVWFTVQELPERPSSSSSSNNNNNNNNKNINSRPEPSKKLGQHRQETSAAADPSDRRRRVLIAVAILLCMFGLVFLMGAVSAFNVPLTTDYFHWGATENSGMLVGIGVLNIITVYTTRALLRTHPGTDERWHLVAFSIATAAGTFFFFVSPGGESVPLWRYVTGYIISSAAFTVAATMAFGIYSKVNAGPASSGFMSWLPATGALGRVLGPTFAGAAKVKGQEGNPNYGVIGGAGVCFVGILSFLAAYRSINVNKDPSVEGGRGGTGNGGNNSNNNNNNNGNIDFNGVNDDYDVDVAEARGLLAPASQMSEADQNRSQTGYIPPQRLGPSPPAPAPSNNIGENDDAEEDPYRTIEDNSASYQTMQDLSGVTDNE